MLTELEVTWWLQHIVGRMRHVSPGVANARPDCWEGREGQRERGIERDMYGWREGGRAKNEGVMV